MSIVVISHNDLDGRCSAAVAYRELKKRVDDEIVLVEMDYDRTLPELPEDVSRIYVLDFSFKDGTFDKFIDLVGKNNVIWLDHHESVIRSLTKWADLPGWRTERWSGSMLTWMWFNLDKEPPFVVKLVDDYDRWMMVYEYTLNFYEWSLGMGLENITGKIWDDLLNMELSGMTAIDYIGADLRSRRYRELREHIKRAGVPIRLVWEGKEYTCMKINSTFTDSTSQLGCMIYDELGYEIAWMHYDKITDKGTLLRTNQLRSVKVDVSRIAEYKGGGGHVNAAGWHEVLKYEAVNAIEII